MWARSESFEALNMVLMVRNSITYSLFSEQSEREIFTGFSNSRTLLRLSQHRMRYRACLLLRVNQNEIPLLGRQRGMRFPFWWDNMEWDSPSGETTRNEFPLLVRQHGMSFPFWWVNMERDSPSVESTRNDIPINQTWNCWVLNWCENLRMKITC